MIKNEFRIVNPATIKQALKCGICLEVYNEPYFVPCGYFFSYLDMRFAESV